MNARRHRPQQGFSLVELMITLTLGLVISGAIIQVLVSSSVTNKLNQAVARLLRAGPLRSVQAGVPRNDAP